MINIEALVREANIPASYATEIRKGVRLSRYVTPKAEADDGPETTTLVRNLATTGPETASVDNLRPRRAGFGSFLRTFPGLSVDPPSNWAPRDVDL